MKKSITCFSILILLLISGCSETKYNCQSDKPKQLIGDFSSYQTLIDFETLLNEKADTLIVFENSRLSDSDTRPEFSIYTVIIPNFTMTIGNGKLRASFYNDRLMSVWFYPDDISEFEEILNSKYGISLNENETIITDCVKIHKWKDLEGNIDFGWTDLKLSNDQNSWISKYA